MCVFVFGLLCDVYCVMLYGLFVVVVLLFVCVSCVCVLFVMCVHAVCH